MGAWPDDEIDSHEVTCSAVARGLGFAAAAALVSMIGASLGIIFLALAVL